MAESTRSNIIDQLQTSIDSDVGNIHDGELDQISSAFDKTLADAMQAFNANTFDDDGFIRKMRDIDTGDKRDQDMVKHMLNNIRSDYIGMDSINQSELLLRRDLYNICTQMPEMHDVIQVVRDAIIECNVATGEVSRSLTFENREQSDSYETQVRELETRYNLLMAIKNFVIPKTLMHGEMYINVVPYSKLFAEIEALHDNKLGSRGNNMNTTLGTTFHESVPQIVMEGFKKSKSLYSEENMKYLTESVSRTTKMDSVNTRKVEGTDRTITLDEDAKSNISGILHNIDVYNGSSVMFTEMGTDGFAEFIMDEYKKERHDKKSSPDTHFLEAQQAAFGAVGAGPFGQLDQDMINIGHYKDIKGCYIKYLDGLRMIPIRMDRRVVGYYYATTTMDLQTNAANPNGIVDLSYQNYTRDRNMVSSLSNLIIRSFDKKFLKKNIRLKNEIAEIIMAHKFSEGRLSFIYIPENEVIRLIINEDEEGRGHSILEPSLFPARMYLMLTLYNMLYTLNNNTTRVHYLRSSGLNKNYASQIQRTMRKFQQRRITIDDIYSYSGVLNKIGGMGEMVLPAGRNDFKALETDTIPAVDNPINIEYLEQQRRQALSGTGAPHLLVINAIDEVDFAKTLEMANTRFLSTVSSYKIDFNNGITKWYQFLMRHCTDIPDDVVQSFRFQFNAAKQQELVITAEMIQNFNSMVEMVQAIYYPKNEMEDKDGNPTSKQMYLRKELAKKYLSQLDFDQLDEIVKIVNLKAGEEEQQRKVNSQEIDKEDLGELNNS